MSACARFILVNYKQDLLGENTVDNTVDQKIALPFYVMLILHLVIYVAYLNFFKNWNSLKKIGKNRQILVSFWWQYSACYSQTVLIVRVIWLPKKNLRQRIYHNLCRVFFFLGKDDSFYSNLLRITWFMEKISLPANWTLIWHLVIYEECSLLFNYIFSWVYF